MFAAILPATIALVACGQSVPSGPQGATTSAAIAVTTPASGSVAAPPIAAPPVSPAVLRFRVSRSALRLPSARSRAVALGFGSTILVCGGLTSSGITTGSIVRIDLRSRHVSGAGSLAAPVHDAGGAALGGSGFVFGGGRFGPGSVVQRVGPDGVATAIGHLPAARADLAAVAVDGEVVVVGGGTPARSDDRVLATTDGRHFRTVARLRLAVRYPAVAVVGGWVYVIGGSTASGDTRVIQAVDPRTGAVRLVGQLAHALSHASAFAIGGALLVAGGRVAGVAQDGLWRLDLASGTVRRIGRLPYAVSDAAVVVVDGTGYLIGGEGLGPLASIITVALR